MTASPIVRYLCCVVVALLPACDASGPDAPYQKYLDNLSAALAISAPDRQAGPSPIPLPVPPTTATLQLPIPASPVDKLDILLLSGCAVQANIGKRQSSLGQHAKPSQRLMLELEFLRLAPECISRLRDSNAALADTLEAALTEKQVLLPALIFNATLGSDEYMAFWRAEPALSDYPASTPEQVTAAMDAVNQQVRRWLSGDYLTDSLVGSRMDDRAFEILLSEIAGGDGGKRLQGWSSQIGWLAAANSMLQTHLIVCGEHKGSENTHKHVTYGRGYIAEVIHPLIAQSRLRYEMSTVPVTTLETLLGEALSQRYRIWVADRNQHVAKLTTTEERHLTLLNQLQHASHAQ